MNRIRPYLRLRKQQRLFAEEPEPFDESFWRSWMLPLLWFPVIVGLCLAGGWALGTLLGY